MKKLFLILFTVSLFTSCRVYYPRVLDVPLIREKGDTRLECGALLTLVHASVSYGLTENIAIQTAGSITAEKSYMFNRDFYIQSAVGFYKNKQNKTVMELYAGFGYGNGSSSNNANPGTLYGNYQIYFTQLNYGGINLGHRGNTEVGFGVKIGYMHSKLTDRNYYGYNRFPPYPVLNMNGILAEPMLILRTGGERLKFQTNIGACRIFRINGTDRYPSFWPITFSIGISYSLSL
jgi:hypothetical protein